MVSDAPARDVLLLKPKSFAFSSSPPLSLMYLASSLREDGHRCWVYDLEFPEDEAAVESVAADDRPLLIGITSTTPDFPATVRLVSRLRSLFPGVPVVIGGIHVSALRCDAVAEAGADFGVIGEGERTLCELVRAIKAGGRDEDLAAIRGLVRRAGAGLVESAPRPLISDVDHIPMPAWDLIERERYFTRPWHMLQKRSRSAFVMTSRGCPFGCTFCASHTTLGRGFRGRSPENVVDEVEYLYRTYDVREFLFIDDNLTFDRDRAAAICREILGRGLDISWRTPNGVRIDTLDDDLLDLMKRSGCYLLGFGIESGEPEVLRRVHKNLDLDGVADRIAMVRRHGIMTFGYFILGLPGETRQSALKTIRFAAKSKFDLAHFGLYAPYPGSAEFEKVRSLPRVNEWDKYLFITPFPVSDLSPLALKGLLRLAYPAFYMNPKRARLLARMMGPKQFAEAVRILYHYMT